MTIVYIPNEMKIKQFCVNCRFCNYTERLKEEWWCEKTERIDALDGSISHHTCYDARNYEMLCGRIGDWWEAK